MKTGGACGGFWYLAGAIDTVVSGLGSEDAKGLYLGRRNWPSSAVTRCPTRPEARVMAMKKKRATLMRASLSARAVNSARVKTWSYGLQGEKSCGHKVR